MGRILPYLIYILVWLVTMPFTTYVPCGNAVAMFLAVVVVRKSIDKMSVIGLMFITLLLTFVFPLCWLTFLAKGTEFSVIQYLLKMDSNSIKTICLLSLPTIVAVVSIFGFRKFLKKDAEM
jgi:hypothetical protein